MFLFSCGPYFQKYYFTKKKKHIDFTFFSDLTQRINSPLETLLPHTVVTMFNNQEHVFFYQQKKNWCRCFLTFFIFEYFFLFICLYIIHNIKNVHYIHYKPKETLFKPDWNIATTQFVSIRRQVHSGHGDSGNKDQIIKKKKSHQKKDRT